MEDPNQKKKNEQKINILSKYQEFYESSVEWGKIEYRLQLSFANVSVSLKKVFSIGNFGYMQSTRSMKISSTPSTRGKS